MCPGRHDHRTLDHNRHESRKSHMKACPPRMVPSHIGPAKAVAAVAGEPEVRATRLTRI
jgi:hypothetical protein